MARRIDVELCEDLVRQAAAGDVVACQKLIEHLWPNWLDLVRASSSMGSFAKSEDHVYEVATRLVAKLGEKNGKILKQYFAWRESHPNQDFGDWMRIVTKNAVCGYMREQLGARQSSSDAPSPKRLLNEYTLAPAIEEQGMRPPMTLEQTAREMMEYAQLKLPTLQVQALAAWLEGSSLEEINERLKLSAGQGRLLLRAAVAVLRRHFKGSFEEIDMDSA